MVVSLASARESWKENDLVLPRTNAGFTLLEVLIALSIVSIAGLAAIAKVGAASSTLREVARHEAEMEAAHNLLVTAMTWSRRELDRRLGSTRAGALMLSVSRPRSGLYRLAVRSDHDLLVTVVNVEAP